MGLRGTLFYTYQKEPQSSIGNDLGPYIVEPYYRPLNPLKNPQRKPILIII